MGDAITKTENDNTKKKWYNPGNLIDGIGLLFDAEPPSDLNVQGAVLWTALAAWIGAASLATWNTRKEYAENAARADKKPFRIALGPIVLY